MRHLGLFEGIGGFSLAARWMGWETVAWVEINPFCQAVLKKNFSEAIGFTDVKRFTYAVYKSVLRHYGITDRSIDIITGGFPCQTFSLAGKGKMDLALWKEMLRIIHEFKPRFVVAENVLGILARKNSVAFETVCADLENEGYEVRTNIIPACGQGAPHRRNRVWFVAHSMRSDARINRYRKDRPAQEKSQGEKDKRKRNRNVSHRVSGQEFTSDTTSLRWVQGFTRNEAGVFNQDGITRPTTDPISDRLQGGYL
jgi:DNA (cytosine-5)-methyltransferase 1